MFKYLFTNAFIVLLLTNAVSGVAQQFTLSGKISGGDNAMVYLSYQNSDKKPVRDSCLLQNNAFTFKGSISEPTRGNLMLKAVGKNSYATAYLEPATTITATGNADNFDKLKVSGSKTHNEYTQLQNRLDEAMLPFGPISARYNAIYKEITAAKKDNRGDKTIDSLNTKLDSVKKLREPFAAKYEVIIQQFVADNPNSYISPAYMGTYDDSWTLADVKKLYAGFSPGVQNSSNGLLIKNKIATREARLLVKPAYNFSKADVNGKTVNLAGFKGRYVLLDFWGSWCIPCREGNPHLKDIFAKYNKAGLDIVAIAVDDTPYDWKKAIAKDGTGIWTNIMDELRGADQSKAIHTAFDVHLFPTKILVDKSGMIIARFSGTGDEAALDKKLSEIFK